MATFRQVDEKIVKGYKATKCQALIDSFLKAEIPVAEVTYEEGEYKNSNSLGSSLKGAIKRFKYAGVDAQIIKGKCYLINNSLVDKEN